MAIVSVKIPQLGEGLQEARLVEFLKVPGDSVSKDEPIYEIETDKAISEIESPYEGTLVEWTVDVDSVLAIGAPIGMMEVAEGTPEMSAGHDAAPPSRHATSADISAASSTFASASEKSGTAAGNVPIPPRTRKLLKEKGLLHLAGQIQAAGSRLMPEDVENFVAAGGSASMPPILTNSFEERPLSPAQRTLNFRMARGAQVVLPAVLETDIDWAAIQAVRDEVRDGGGPTGFAMLSWCIAQAMQMAPPFRSTLSADGEILRTYKHANLGIAVSLADDVLHTAVVRDADTLSKQDFFAAFVNRIQEARDGIDQVDATTTVTVSNIGTAGMRVGIPVVVTPAVATVALGAVRDEPVPTPDGFEFRKMVSLTMSFDHRLVNGIGAAKFLNSIRELAANFKIDMR